MLEERSEARESSGPRACNLSAVASATDEERTANTNESRSKAYNQLATVRKTSKEPSTSGHTYLPLPANTTGMEKVPLSERESAEAVEGVHLSQLAVGEKGSIQHFRIEPGATVPEHSHHHEQLGYIFDGVLTFVVDGEEVDIGSDDSYHLESDEPHAAENQGDVTVTGIDIFCPPRANPDWMD